MYDHRMQPVWIHGVPDNVYSLNFRTQTYNGKPALSWWEGNLTPTGATLSGTDYVVNQNYKIVAKLTGQDGWVFSPHEFAISGGHFAWVTAYKNIPMDLVPYGGVLNGTLTDTAVQEYDLNTGHLVYSWDAVDHIPLSESETKPPPPSNPAAASTGWDAFHLNAIQPLSRRPVPGLDAEHVGRLPGRREHGEHHLDARRQGEHVLRAGERVLPVAARRAAAAQRHDQHVRQRLLRVRSHGLPAAERADAGARPEDGHGGPSRDAGLAVLAARRHGRQSGRHAAAAERQRAGRIRAAAVLRRVHEGGQAAVRGPAAESG